MKGGFVIKNLNVPLELGRHEDLELIQQYYSEKTGMKFTKAQALRRVLFETANLIRNVGETYPGRKWDFEELGKF